MPIKVSPSGLVTKIPGVADLPNPDSISRWEITDLERIVEELDGALYAARGGHDQAFVHPEQLKGALISRVATALRLLQKD